MAILAYLTLRLLFPLVLLIAVALALFLRVLPGRRQRREQKREWDARHIEAEFLPEEPGGSLPPGEKTDQ